MSAQVVIANPRVLEDAERRLREFEKPQIDRLLFRAAAAGARVYVRPLRAEARRMHHGPSTGPTLADSVRAAKVHNRGGIAYAVGPFGPTAHLVIKGTAARHSVPATARVIKFTSRTGETVYAPSTSPGPMPANPFVSRIGETYLDAARAKVRETVIRAADKRR